MLLLPATSVRESGDLMQQNDEEVNGQRGRSEWTHPLDVVEDDTALLEAAIRAWQQIRSGLNSSNFADRLREEGWSPDGPPGAALIALMQRAPFHEHFSLRNGLWYLTTVQEPP